MRVGGSAPLEVYELLAQGHGDPPGPAAADQELTVGEAHLPDRGLSLIHI